MQGTSRLSLALLGALLTLIFPRLSMAQVTVDYGLDFLLHAQPSQVQSYFRIFNEFDQSFRGTEFDFGEARRHASSHGMSWTGRIDKEYIAIERCARHIPSDQALQELNRQFQEKLGAKFSPAAIHRLGQVISSVFTRNRYDVIQGKSFRMLAGALADTNGYPSVMIVPLDLWFIQMPYGSCKYPSYWLRAEAEGFWAALAE